MSKKFNEEVKEIKEETGVDTEDVNGESESDSTESKPKKLWDKVKKPLFIGLAVLGGLGLGKALFGGRDDEDSDDTDFEEVDED